MTVGRDEERKRGEEEFCNSTILQFYNFTMFIINYIELLNH